MKKLYRSKTDRKIAGVCGGLSTYMNVDANVIRIVFVLLALPGGFPGIIPYLVLWLIMPEEA